MKRFCSRYRALLILSLSGLMGAFIFTACEEQIDLELNDQEHQRIVVEGLVTTSYGPQYIRLTQTLSYFQHEAAPGLKDVEAKIIEEGSGLEFPLEMVDDSMGMYKTPDMAGHVGESYILEIKHNDQVYQAKTMLDTVPDIDSVSVAYIIQGFFGFKDTSYSFRASFQEPEPEGHNYFALVYLNDTLYTDQLVERAYFNDFQFNGFYWSNVELFTLPAEDITLDTNTVRIELYSMSAEEIDFLMGIIQESYGNGSIYSGAPANIPTNVYNTTDGIDGVGFFGASDKSVIELTFPKIMEQSSGGPFF